MRIGELWDDIRFAAYGAAVWMVLSGVIGTIALFLS